MAKRSGLSISVKMILVSTLLVLSTAMGLGIMDVLHLEEAYDAMTESRIANHTAALESRGTITTQLMAHALAHSSHGADRQSFANTVRRIAAGDEVLRMVYVRWAGRDLALSCDRAAGAHDCTWVAPTTRESLARARESWRDAVDGASPRKLEFSSEVGPGMMFTQSLAQPSDSAQDAPEGVALIYSLEALERITVQGRAALENAQNRAILRIFAGSVVFVVLCVTVIGFYGMRVSRRLMILAWKADRIARDEFDLHAESLPNDEIGVLGTSFNRMADRVRALVEETRATMALEKEFEVARTIQETLVPSNDPVHWGCFSFAGYFQPASQCGGDWWTYHGLADGKLLLLVGDATGHGLPSAMITAAAKAACDVARAANGNRIDVSTLLALMNRAIYESAKRRLVMTCFAATICPDTRVITYANAGHNFPYLYRVGEDGLGEFGSLMIRGNRLGDLKDSQYESKTTQLRPGDTLIWYTDGVVEGENAKGEEYGEKRFRASIRQAVHLSAGDLRNTVVSDAMEFYGKARRKDDFTMIVGRVS